MHVRKKMNWCNVPNVGMGFDLCCSSFPLIFMIYSNTSTPEPAARNEQEQTYETVTSPPDDYLNLTPRHLGEAAEVKSAEVIYDAVWCCLHHVLIAKPPPLLTLCSFCDCLYQNSTRNVQWFPLCTTAFSCLCRVIHHMILCSCRKNPIFALPGSYRL